MATYSLADYSERIYNSGLIFFTVKTLKDTLLIEKKDTFFGVLRKFLKSNTLEKIERNKFYLKKAKFHDFSLSNFLYEPSYISFESALNFYGILSQFPYEITSTTTKKSKQKKIEEKLYSYTHLKKDLYWGFEKENGFLIAKPEKALLDQLYLVSKGLKALELEDLDLSSINKGRLDEYSVKFPKTPKFRRVILELKKIIKLK